MQRSYYPSAQPLLALFAERRFLSFTAVWFGTNLAIGLIGIGNGMTIAWDAHIGGFLAGLLLFPLFDPVPAPPADPVDLA